MDKSLNKSLNKLMQAVSKAVCFLKASNILVDVKEAILPVLIEEKQELKTLVEQYINSKTPEVKTLLLDFIFDKIKLPFPVSLFKGTAKKAIANGIDNLVQFLLVKLQEV